MIRVKTTSVCSLANAAITTATDTFVRMHRSCALLFILWITAASGQSSGYLHGWFNGDTTRVPDHDTAWIISYRDDLCVSPVSTYQGSALEIERKDGGSLSYATNTPIQFGAALDYKWIGIEATFTIPGISQLDPSLGETKARGLGFGITGRKWWFRNFILESKGFYADDPELVDPDWSAGDPLPFRGDLENLTYMASVNHGFNARRYSQTAAIWQMERQKRSAGSWTVGASFWFSRTRATGSLVPEFDRASYSEQVDVRSVRRWVISATGGYAHTFVLWHHGFINLMVVPGIGAQQQALDPVDGGERSTGWDAAATTEFRLGTGWVADRWYAAFTLNVYESSGEISDDLDLSSTVVNLRLAAGWRFRHIKPLWKDIGL